nr:MAG TPA_asm: hypothetical protein [Caudoviricetes sp.]
MTGVIFNSGRFPCVIIIRNIACNCKHQNSQK